MPTKHLDEEAIFHAARRIDSPDERAKFIDQACAGDTALAERVQALLEISERDPQFLEAPALKRSGTIDYEPIVERPGSRVGPYRLMEQIGEGGFGLVFVAEQQEPVKRKVALKVIKPGMDSAQVIARFEAERQALALMDHPNIAKVLDAGATESGRPYFVMELVRGIPITEYCDQNQLSPRERLDLFITVCQAIQHAHQKGIIHRDIKPSNVLVTSHDGKPVAKVIDFGVAKAIHQHLTERTLYTNFAQMVGTPLYMSPEQAEMSGLDIDTRSDIYSLGVLLYELLTGTTPLEKKQLREAAYDEIRRLIREKEPPKPSTRLSTSESIASVAAQRNTEPAKLSKLVRGDLDWITMKALEKDRTRRYETATGLARDIQRHLNDEPVEAGPPNTVYRLRKFARRNRAAVFYTALTIACAVAILVNHTLGVFEIRRERDRAIAAEQAAQAATEAERLAKQDARDQEKLARAAAEAERKAKETAEAREAESRAVLSFLENRILAAARPKGEDGGLGRNVTLRQALETALPYVAEAYPNQPLVEANVRSTLGMSFRYLGEAKIASEQFQQALELFERHRGRDDPNTLACMTNLANSFADLGRHADALELHQQTLSLARTKFGLDHFYTLRSMGNTAHCLFLLGRYDRALQLNEELLPLWKSKFGPDHINTFRGMNNLANCYSNLGRHADALKMQDELLSLSKSKLGPDHPHTLRTMNNLAGCYAALGRQTEALQLREETLALRKVILGADHPETLSSMTNLANSYEALGRDADALQLRKETVTLMKAKLGADHPDTLVGMQNLAASYDQLDQHADALPLYSETLTLMEAKLGGDHPTTLMTMRNPAWLLATTPTVQLRNPERAIVLAQRAAQLAPDRPEHWAALGIARYRAGEWKAAIADFDRINTEQSRSLRVANVPFFRAMALWQLGEIDRARECLAQAEGGLKQGLQSNSTLKRVRAEAAQLLQVRE